MEFIIDMQQRSVRGVAEKIGYLIRSHDENNFSMVRKASSGDYPCFHLHITMINGGEVGHRFVLHLDRRKMADEHDCDHHGKYHGKAIQAEGKRIKSAIDALETIAPE